MPTLVWLYLTALLYYRTSATCVALAEALQTVSHDRLTRMLQADWSGQRLLERACRTLFVWERGYLIIDDTVVPKPFATAMEGLAWVYLQPGAQAGVWLLPGPAGLDGWDACAFHWACGSGTRVAPPSMRWPWSCSAMPAIACAVARTYVLFDAWYPSKALLKRIRDYGWYFVCRLKKNRRFNGQPLRAYRRHPYWAETGWLTGGLKVLVVRYGAKYYATNRLTLPGAVDAPEPAVR